MTEKMVTEIKYCPIGIKHSPFKDIEGMPIQSAAAAGIRGSVELFTEYEQGLQDIDGYSHIILIYHFQPKATKISDSDESVLVKKLQTIVQQYEKDFNKKSVEELLKAILNAREKARKGKDWKTADKIRKELEDIGFEIQDTETGPVWRKK